MIHRTMPIWAAAVAAALAVPTAAQEPPGRETLLPPHHRRDVPNYLEALVAPGLIPIAMPSPPREDPTLEPPHLQGGIPTYVEAVRSAEARPILLPPPPPGAAPAVVRGLYLNAWVFGSRRFWDLVALADTTEINAFVIDVKDATGYLTYRSSVATAVEIGANELVRAPDAHARLAALEARGIHPIARIVVARDPLLANRRADWAVRDADGGLWLDGLGEPWVDAFHDSVWAYAADLAAEAVLMGFREIQFDYIRFPDEPASRMQRARFTARTGGQSRRSAIMQQVAYLKDRVAQLGVPFTLDVFGMTTSASDDMGIGQYWEDLVQLADVLLPMVYPSHYPATAYGIQHPNAEPYAIVRRALEDGLRRAGGAGAARIRPYLQAFTLGRPRYTGAEVRAQIQATEDLGLTDWVLWNARGVYPPDALRPARAPGARRAVPPRDAPPH